MTNELDADFRKALTFTERVLRSKLEDLEKVIAIHLFSDPAYTEESDFQEILKILEFGKRKRRNAMLDLMLKRVKMKANASALR